MSNNKTYSIGQIAKRAEVSTSLLRYYEKEGLLKPIGRTEAGYRLYNSEAIRDLRFIRKAQRYGFSLNDIKLMRGLNSNDKKPSIGDIAEKRFVEIERRVTEMLVLRHELEMFLDDITEKIESSSTPEVAKKYKILIEEVCSHNHIDRKQSSLKKLSKRLGCKLASEEWENLFHDLRGQHVHVWQETDKGYSVLYSNTNNAIIEALKRLAAGENNCEAHSEPEVISSEGGILFRAKGHNAFLFAQLFLAIDSATTCFRLVKSLYILRTLRQFLFY
ncbi:MAG: MerR family transcriptional regulator [Pseudomonadota bacterium]|nr:MerR family transcriptional regulator [Pseudomonadota bacterium]